MSTTKTVFTVIESINCPLYSKGDQMSLTTRSCSCGNGKDVCLVLARDLMNILVAMQRDPEGDLLKITETFNCSGCTGLIKFAEHFKNGETDNESKNSVHQLHRVMEEINGRNIDCPFLEALQKDKIDNILDNFEPMPVPAKSILVQQNRPSLKLYLVLSGRFALERNKEIISVVNAGEIVGEMSCLGAVHTLWSVRALEDATVIDVTAQKFGHLVSSSATVLTYVAKLLAIRLELLNAVKLIDTKASMSGSLADLSTAELCQVFNLHQKSGVLRLSFTDGDASISFRDGGIINAKFKKLVDREALFTVFSKNDGFYRFIPGLSATEQKAAEIGEFMMLLMEGVQKDDERMGVQN